MKKVGKIVIIAFVVLILLGSLAAACSKSSSSTASSGAAEVESSQASKPVASTESKLSSSSSESSESTIEHDPDLVGTWDMTALKQGETNLSEDEVKSARDRGIDSYMVFNEDGSALLVIGDDQLEFTWLSADESTGLVSNSDSALTYSKSGNKLVLGSSENYFKFERGKARTAESNQDSADKDGVESEASASAENGEVSPDLKEMLDSYEAFMDEYVEFMNSYKESGDTVSMLSQYTEYMQKYTDLMQKIEAVDTSNMSAADYAYYIEVTSRVSEKLLKVSGI